MKNEEKTLKALKEKFPGYKNEIDQFFVADEIFRELCEDYLFCQDMINTIESTDNADKRREAQEYHNAMQELELEINGYLLGGFH